MASVVQSRRRPQRQPKPTEPLAEVATATPPPNGHAPEALFAPAESPVVAELKAVDVDGLTPREALARLAELVAKARGT